MMNSVKSVRCVASIALLALLMINGVASHSWVHCTDYRINSQADADYYKPENCKAYPRAWSQIYNPGVFGTDTGFNFQATENQACRDRLGSAPDYGYTTQYPMATYAQNQMVCLAWPSKNHVAETCTNPYIPDTELQLFISGPNPTADLTLSGFEKNVLVAALNGKHRNGQIDHLGFQNCSKFCENMDKSLCNGCFKIPSSLTVGAVYTFQWYWIFNEGSAPYTTCWEARITGPASSGSSGSGSSGTATSATSNTASSGSSGSATSNTASSGSSGSATSNTASSGSSGSATSNTASSGSSASSSSSGSATSNTASSGSSDSATSNTASSGSSGSATSNTASSGSSGSASSATGSSSSGSSGSNGEFVVISKAPTTIPMMGSFDVEVAFVTTTTRQVVVEVFDYQNNGYAKGVATVNGKGASEVGVTIYNAATKGANYKIRSTLVVNGYSNNYAGYVLDYVEVPCGAGDQVVYANGGNSTVSAAMPKGSSQYSAYLPVVCILTFFLAYVIAL